MALYKNTTDERDIDVSDLIIAGFKEITKSCEKEFWERNGVKNYSEWQLWTPDGKALIVMSYGNTNNNALWGMHVDNEACDSIGSADISTVYQFNLIMEALNLEYRLK